MQVTATDADDPTYGNSARLVYSILQGQPYFSVEPQTGEDEEQRFASTHPSTYSLSLMEPHARETDTRLAKYTLPYMPWTSHMASIDDTSSCRVVAHLLTHTSQPQTTQRAAVCNV